MYQVPYSPHNMPADSSVSSVAEYSGGFCYRHDDSAPPTIGPQELPTLTHVAMGFQSSSHQVKQHISRYLNTYVAQTVRQETCVSRLGVSIIYVSSLIIISTKSYI